MGDLIALAEEWLRIDKDADTRAEMQALIQQNNRAELQKRLVGRIAFGTAGLRAAMGAGFTRMNSVTVLQASQGLAAYLLQADPQAKEKGVVIGHDARFNSQKYASLTAAAFIAQGIKVHWYDKLVHTPLVPFAVIHKSAAAGIMVTASHNPPQDNGYKVYWSNGCQIIPPHDSNISTAITKNLEPVTWAVDIASPLLGVLGPDVEEAYYQKAASLVPFAPIQLQAIPSVYTPLHGVGLPFLIELTKRIAGPDIKQFVHIVPEQAQPDPSFSTVEFPNPEEQGALDLAIRDASSLGRKLIIANDPDADRLALAEYITPSVGTSIWRQFTGNEVGILLASYALELYQPAHQSGKLCMLCSTVSSMMLKAMAKAEGFKFVETLTGFKWLGNVAQQLAVDGSIVPYAFEEALGYMFTEVVWDKDGVSSATAFLAAATRWLQQGMTPYQKLDQLYQKYGYFADANTYLISPSPEVTNHIFNAIRARGDDPSRPHPATVGGMGITSWRDLTVGFDSATSDNKPELPVDASAQMITCELATGIRFTARGSGTEPKIKLYVEGRGTSSEDAKSKAIEAQQFIISEWFTPIKNR